MQFSEFKTQIKKFLSRRENKLYLTGITGLVAVLVLSYNVSGNNLTGALIGSLSPSTARVSSPQISAPAVSSPAPSPAATPAVVIQPIVSQPIGVSGAGMGIPAGPAQLTPVKKPTISNIVISQGEKIVTITYTLADSSGKATLEPKILTKNANQEDLEIKKWDTLVNQSNGTNTLTWDSPPKGNYIFSIGGTDDAQVIQRQTKEFIVTGPAATLICDLDNKEVKPGETVTYKATLNDASDSNTIYSWSGDGGTGKGTTLEAKFSSEITISNQTVTASDPNSYGTLTASCPTLIVKDSSQNDKGDGAGVDGGKDCTIDDSCKAAVDVVSCNLTQDTTALDNSAKATLECTVKPTAYVTALVVKGDFDPSTYNSPSEIESKEVIRKLKNNQLFKDDGEMSPDWDFSLIFEGKDKFDTKVAAGEYTFLVYARPDSNRKYDVSKKVFKVVQSSINKTQPPEKTQETNKLKGSAPESNLSKCNTKYPKDIKNHWGEAMIKASYDLCIVSGFADQTFKPNAQITRAQAVKIGLSALGIKPAENCIDAECGTGFQDLTDKNLSGYIKVAKSIGAIQGYNKTTFGPNKIITRAEAVAFIAKLAFAAKLTPEPFFKGCYNAHCGAGYPNIFYDITNISTGAYLKELLKLNPNLIVGGPNAFRPNDPITRAEILKIFFKLRELRVK